MLLLLRRQCTPQIAGRIALGTTGRYGISENASADLERSVRRPQLAEGLYTTQARQQIRSFDLGNGHPTDPREHTDLEPADDLA